MAIRLISTRGMPNDELEEICALLGQHNIAYTVTPPGNWLISAGNILLTDDQQLSRARELMHSYQQQRAEQQRKNYAERCSRGEQENIVRRITRAPLLFIGYLVIIIFILYLSIKPFFDLGN